MAMFQKGPLGAETSRVQELVNRLLCWWEMLCCELGLARSRQATCVRRMSVSHTRTKPKVWRGSAGRARFVPADRLCVPSDWKHLDHKATARLEGNTSCGLRLLRAEQFDPFSRSSSLQLQISLWAFCSQTHVKPRSRPRVRAPQNNGQSQSSEYRLQLQREAAEPNEDVQAAVTAVTRTALNEWGDRRV
jgi:hypothetical protein